MGWGGGIKTTEADKWFSKCVRERAAWKCEFPGCGKQYDKSSQGLHCSHCHGRGNWSVRLDPDNAASICAHHHLWLEANPHEHRKFFEERLGEGLYQILLEKKNNTSLGKEYKRTKGVGPVSIHYKRQYEDMQDKRNAGDTGRIEFVGWI